MIIIESIAEMQQTADRLRAEGKHIGFVPTMGFLHEGHLDLLRLAKARCDVTVMSVFVNPTQFAAGEDLATYPRNLARDCRLAGEVGCDIVFAPKADEMYPAHDSTWVQVEKIGTGYEGTVRPTHFRGVSTVVTKLFHIVRPHLAVFGQKDAQQAALIRRMTADLHFGIDIVIAPIHREPDGLAMSSRNTYLSDQERKEALALSRALEIANVLFLKGERSVDSLQRAVEEEILRSSGVELDYAAIVDPDSFLPVEGRIDQTAVITVAARVGKTRLIDNLIVRNGTTQS